MPNDKNIQGPNLNSVRYSLVVLSLIAYCLWFSPTQAMETSPAAAATGSSEFSLEPNTKEYERERAEIEKLLADIENEWNSHNLEGVMKHYADDYINNDGLDKKSVAALTQDFWKTYPDAKSSSKTKQIRIEGNFAAVESRDMALGNTAKEMSVIGTRGELNSVSEGQLYLKKIGNSWKIIGDRIDYEKVRVAFGLARQLSASFSAPEQVKSGHQYTAKLEMNLPVGLAAVGSIISQPLIYPQPATKECWKLMESPILERVMPANTNNRNELLMATIGITNASRNNLMGIAFITRRLNVVPNGEDRSEKVTEKSTAKSDSTNGSALFEKINNPVKDAE